MTSPPFWPTNLMERGQLRVDLNLGENHASLGDPMPYSSSNPTTKDPLVNPGLATAAESLTM
jgi:hypothetical protein